MTVLIGWSCDFCKKGGLTISSAGVIYCSICRMSYGKTIYDTNKHND